MKLPEITQEILDKFGILHGENTQLIKWRLSEREDIRNPQWTQAAVDFAHLIAPKVAELESAGRALLEWDKRYPKGVAYNSVLCTRCENELTALIERFRALLEPITSEDKQEGEE